MFTTKLERFITKRALIYFIVLFVVIFSLMKDVRWVLVAGLFVGTVFSVARFSGYAWVFARIADLTLSSEKPASTQKRAFAGSIFAFVLNLSILLPIIFVSYTVHLFLFVGLIVGIFSVPIVIMINSVTEAVGITKNHFE